MPTDLRADARRLRVVGGPPVDGAVDVLLDGHRVWSTPLPEADRHGVAELPWPDALRPYLRGKALVSVVESASGEALGELEVAFGGSGRVSVTDSAGRWLAMNKWNRLGPSFEGDGSGVQERLLASADRLVTDLQEWGYPVFVVGGTLLGAMRSGELLAHDDDIDLAWYCEEQDPADIALASYEMQRRLDAAGYVVVRHSQAHLQVTFVTDDGDVDHYIDVFTGFHRGEEYCQPFALSGTLARQDIVPTAPVQLSGHTYPGPARPEAWLELAYGPGWLVPDPSFRFEPSTTTVRRFETWFGVYNRNRVFWEKHYESVTEGEPTAQGADDVEQFLALVPPRSRVVDLGCGDGVLTRAIAAAGHDVLGVDYSLEALRVARGEPAAGAGGAPSPEFRYVNLNETRESVRLAIELLRDGRPTYLFARDLLAAMPRPGRLNVLGLVAAVADEQTFAFATTYPELPDGYEHIDPRTWHLTMAGLRRDTRATGLTFRVLDHTRVRTTVGARPRATVLLRRPSWEQNGVGP